MNDGLGNPYDVVIRIGERRRRQTWSAETAIHKGRMTRIGGRSQGSTSAHSLLAIATITALRVIKGARLKELQQRIGTRTPKVLIQTIDPTFAFGLRGFVAREFRGDWKVARPFWKELSHQLARFSVTVELAESNDPRVGILNTWTAQTVMPSEDVNDVPSIFQPKVIAEVF